MWINPTLWVCCRQGLNVCCRRSFKAMPCACMHALCAAFDSWYEAWNQGVSGELKLAWQGRAGHAGRGNKHYALVCSTGRQRLLTRKVTEKFSEIIFIFFRKKRIWSNYFCATWLFPKFLLPAHAVFSMCKTLTMVARHQVLRCASKN